MISRKQRIKVIALIGMMSVGICGCSLENKGKTSEKNSIKNQEITYCTWEDEKDYTEKIVNTFEAEYSNIHVNIKYIDSNIKETGLEKCLDSEKIDVIGVKNINDVLTLKQKGQVIDLTGKIADSDIDISYYGNMYNDISDNGKYYCLPTRKTSWALVYNPDIFEEEGIKEPGKMTWDEFADLAAKMTKQSGDRKIWGTYFVDWVYNFMGIQEKEYLYDDDQTYLKKSLELLNRIYYKDQSSMTPAEAKKEDWISSYEQGNIAMMPMGEWFVGQILADEKSGKTDVNWELAPIPTPEKQVDDTTWGTYQLAAITKACKNSGKTDAAFQFLEYLCGEEGAKIYASNGMIPAYINHDIETIYKSAVGSHNVDAFFETWQIQENPVFEGYTDLEDILEKETGRYLERKQDLDTTMKNFEAKRTKYLEKIR